MKKNAYFYTNLLAWGLVFFLIGNYVFGWTTPSANAPSTNLPAPINVSSTEQTKTGNLIIDSLLKIGRYVSAPSGSVGSLYFDTTADEFKGYKSSGWDSLGGVPGLWTQSGTDIYYNDGNVGIGIASPGAKLDVTHGTAAASVTTNVIRFKTPVDPAVAEPRSVDFNLRQWSSAGTAANTAFDIKLAAAGDGAGNTNIDVMTLQSNGNVGIGTTDPAGLLHVKKPSTFSATGGTITYIGGYAIHTFTTSGTFTPGNAGNIEVLVVAGGGSGGNHNTTNGNGGGGGGGVIYNPSFAVTAQAYTVTVGNGGAAIPNATIGLGNNGQNSVFSSLTAIGGGGGGSTGVGGGLDGGSGGGAAYNGYVGGVSTQTGGYGNDGGATAIAYTGGGGGGAGSAGVAGSASSPGANGGTGYSSSVSGSTEYYAGGGGGGGNSSQRAGDGFDGGGRGCGTTSYYAYNVYTDEVNTTTRGSGTPNAIANTGGGGGAGSYWAANGGWPDGSGVGGSGIVIIRYPTTGVEFIVKSDGKVGIGTADPGTAILKIFGGVLDMSSQKITNLATPTADTDAATKGYVDVPKTMECTTVSGVSGVATCSATCASGYAAVSGTWELGAYQSYCGGHANGTWESFVGNDVYTVSHYPGPCNSNPNLYYAYMIDCTARCCTVY